MPEFCCSLCSLPFGSEVGVKVHYSKMHGKENCGISNIDDSRFFDYNQLFELCEIFGGEDVQLHDEDIVLEDNSINMENEECILELVRKCSEEESERRFKQCRDYHSQIEIVMKHLKDAQAILNGMQIQPPWIKGSYCVYKIVFPAAFLWAICQCMINSESPECKIYLLHVECSLG